MQNNDFKPKNYERGKARALHILCKSDKTEFELRNKLIHNEYSEEIVDKIILFLKEYGYIDDYNYAMHYVSEKSKYKSLMQIRSALKLKGVSVSLIEEAFLLNSKDQSELIKYLVEKRKINWDNQDKKEVQKLYNFLFRKGFKSSEISSVIKHFQGDIK